MTIAEALRRVKSIKLREEVPLIIERQKADIILLNQIQLLHGMDSASIKLAPYKSKYYAAKKALKNPSAGGSADLKNTGEFYQDFNISTKGGKLNINSSNFKTDRLLKLYGVNIFGLTKENKTTYSIDDLLPAVQKHITNKTGFKFR